MGEAGELRSGRDELLSAGTVAFGAAPVLITEGLEHLPSIAAWRVPGSPSRWLLMSMGNSLLDIAPYRYDFSGRGYELLCEVEAETIPNGILALLDQASQLAQAIASDGKLTGVRRVGKHARLRNSTLLAPLETSNGRVNFIDLLPDQPEGLVTAAGRLFAAAKKRARTAVNLSWGPDARARSHAGGSALVPASFVWPRHEALALPLLLELDLSELPGDPIFPTTGRLLLFGSPDGRHRHYELRYVEGEGVARSEGDPLAVHALSIVPFADLPSASALRNDPVLRGLSEERRGQALEGYTSLVSSSRSMSMIQLLGWQHPHQDDVIVEALLGLHQLALPLPTKRYAALEREAEDWLVLLQLASGQEWDFSGGSLFIVAHRDDVLARRFESARAVVQA